MRFQRHVLLVLFSLTATALPAAAQPKRSLVLFGDGFSFEGQIKQGMTSFVDPVSKEPIYIPLEAEKGGFYTIDDDVRTIIFPPNKLLKLIHDDPILKRDWVRLQNDYFRSTKPLPGGSWSIKSVGRFEASLMRGVRLTTPAGWVQLDQRMVTLTPRFLRADAVQYDWKSYYFTRELGADATRSLVNKYITWKKQPEKEIDKRLLVYRFLLQAGWTTEAEKELEKIIDAFPAQRERLLPMKAALTKLLTIQFVDDLELASKVGQHAAAEERLARFAQLGMAAHVGDKTLIQMQALKNKYQAAGEKLKDARRFFKLLPTGVPPVRREFFGKAVAAIAGELNHDTLPRLETFLSQARDWERAREQNRPPAQTPEQLLAFAVSGWVLGDGAADKNVDMAKKLWEARELVLACQQKDEDFLTRKDRIGKFESRNKDVSVDLVARMIPLLPPPEPFAKLSDDPIKLKVETPGPGQGLAYEVQLPPEYHHYRPYPVLFVLHHSAEKPGETLARWRDLARQHGYILVAPAWGRGFKPAYGYTAAEHLPVLACLRDLRQRFQVDSDRVFLFGFEQGGRMAFDVGLSHPDLFAGVLPMSAAPRFHGFRYWTNAQLLPFYVVNGEYTGELAKHNRTLFKDWVRFGYPSVNIEYRGRAAEWFEAEPEFMIDWMNRKKRVYPLKEAGASGHEFKTMRPSDNRFYWLSTDDVLRGFCNSADAWRPTAAPATMYARIFLDNQINVRTHGLGQVTVWLGPASINYADKVTLYVNGQKLAPRTITPSLLTLLESFCQLGDRQRLFWAMIPLKV